MDRRQVPASRPIGNSTDKDVRKMVAAQKTKEDFEIVQPGINKDKGTNK